MSFDNSKISTQEATKILYANYDIEGSVIELDGEIDFNFKVNSVDGKNYLLKISRSGFNSEYIDFQIKLLDHLNKNCEIEIAGNELTVDGEKSCIIKDNLGKERSVRLLSWIEGRLWSSANPINKSLRNDLGSKTAMISKSLTNFSHSFSKRKIEWDISNSLWVEDYIEKFEVGEKKIIKEFIKDFKAGLPIFNKLKKSIIHNDINDNNIIISNDLLNPKIESIIDFGDSVFTQTINDLAITCSYGIMNLNDPLSACCDIVNGYNAVSKISDDELKILFNLVSMRLIISVTKSLINKVKEPENKYLLISEKSAWEVLKKWVKIDSEFAYYSFRKACGTNAHPNQNKFYKWAKKNKFSATDLFPSVKKK